MPTLMDLERRGRRVAARAGRLPRVRRDARLATRGVRARERAASLWCTEPRASGRRNRRRRNRGNDRSRKAPPEGGGVVRLVKA